MEKGIAILYKNSGLNSHEWQCCMMTCPSMTYICYNKIYTGRKTQTLLFTHDFLAFQFLLLLPYFLLLARLLHILFNLRFPKPLGCFVIAAMNDDGIKKLGGSTLSAILQLVH